MTLIEQIKELIYTQNYTLISERENRPLFDDEDTDCNKEYEVLIDLNVLDNLTHDEEREILKIREIEIEGDWYYIEYKTVFGINKKNRKEVA